MRLKDRFPIAVLAIRAPDIQLVGEKNGVRRGEKKN